MVSSPGTSKAAVSFDLSGAPAKHSDTGWNGEPRLSLMSQTGLTVKHSSDNEAGYISACLKLLHGYRPQLCLCHIVFFSGRLQDLCTSRKMAQSHGTCQFQPCRCPACRLDPEVSEYVNLEWLGSRRQRQVPLLEIGQERSPNIWDSKLTFSNLQHGLFEHCLPKSWIQAKPGYHPHWSSSGHVRHQLYHRALATPRSFAMA